MESEELASAQFKADSKWPNRMHDRMDNEEPSKFV
jgi:hypothetical protein